MLYKSPEPLQCGTSTWREGHGLVRADRELSELGAISWPRGPPSHSRGSPVSRPRERWLPPPPKPSSGNWNISCFSSLNQSLSVRDWAPPLLLGERDGNPAVTLGMKTFQTLKQWKRSNKHCISGLHPRTVSLHFLKLRFSPTHSKHHGPNLRKVHSLMAMSYSYFPKQLSATVCSPHFHGGPVGPDGHSQVRTTAPTPRAQPEDTHPHCGSCR